MGVDIEGCVEVRKTVAHDYEPKWVGVALIAELVERNYGMFGAILDVRNHDGFPAPFANRGLPPDMAEATSFQASLLGGGMFQPSWALWTEIATMWGQMGAREHVRVLTLEQWQHERDNPLFVIESSLDTSNGARVQRYRKDHPELGLEIIVPGEDPRIGPCYFRRGHFAVGEVISTGWQACFDVMASLSTHFGSDQVRLVAWCDSE